MSNFIEIERFRKDTAATRDLAKRLLSLPDDTFNATELDFLSNIARFDPKTSSRFFARELSTLQVEWLLDIRDGLKDHATTPQGFSVATLIENSWLARLDLDADDHIEFLDRIRGRKTLKARQLGLLLHISRKLGLIEQYA